MQNQAFMKVDISSILGQINENITFFQPLFEAIINSLDAQATKIDIDIKTDRQKTLFDNVERVSIVGYSVTDNGVGFNKDNRESFSKYLSTYKQKIGCKGIGRFTWLKIFGKIDVVSYTGTEKVSFNFNKNFSENNIKIENNENIPQTTINFNDINTDYYKKYNNEKLIDSDDSLIIDIEKIKEIISDYLSVKLFLLNNSGTKFNITLKLGKNITTINNDNIIKFKEKIFTISSSVGENQQQIKYDFSLYYAFENNEKNIHKHFYCAHGRTVKPFTRSIDPKLLPNDDSSIMLLTSEYFNERTNNEWNEFIFSMSDNNKTLTNPLPIPYINEHLRTVIDTILLEKYPALANDNQKIIEESIDEYPYLAKYIKEDKSQIKVKSDVVKSAQKKFVDEKEKVKANFIKILESNKHTNKKVFIDNIAKINDISARELAQYFLYREQIIKAIQKVKDDKETTEADLHNLFMKMGIISNSEERDFSIYDTNLWLFDDKFLTYNCAFSDKKLKIIKEYVSKEQNINNDNNNCEPDIAIFYNNVSNNAKDVVIIEFKSPNAKDLQNGVGIYELSRNIYPIVETIDNVRMVFGYVVLNINEQMAKNLSKQAGVKTISFGDYPIFYVYNENIEDKNHNKIPVHLYIMSIDSICIDAELRNRTFLDIIKNK
jgi:hypothetical protein